MRKFSILALLLFSLSSAYSQDKRLDGLDTFINRMLKDWHAAGVSVAVVEKNKVLLAKGYGYRDIEKKLPVTDETLFAIGSCTKAFTASLLGMLAQDNKLELDKPVVNYLPELRFYTPELTEQVTVKDMMTHRTGLPRHDYAWYGSDASRDSLLYRIRFFENSAKLREAWQYNNFMFMAQGCLTEKLTGKKWEDLLAEKIFNPIGMVSSSPRINALETGNNASLGYRAKDDSVITKMKYRNINAMGPAGSINSNAKDMARWVTTWVNGGKYNGKEIIPASYAMQAMSPQMVIGGGLPTAEAPDIQFANYGFAWFLSSYRGHYLVQHGGNIDGFSANTAFYPSDSIGIVVLTNQNGSVLPGLIRNAIADKMLKLPYRNWHQIVKAQVAKSKLASAQKQSSDSLNRKMGTHPSHSLADYEGSYRNPGYGTVIIRKTGDSLAGEYHTQKLRLRHYHYDVFNAYPENDEGQVDKDQDATKVNFTMNAKGDIDLLKIALEPGVKDIEFNKDIVTVKLSKAELEKFTGEYELPGVKAKVYLKGDSTLYLFVPGQPDYELVPVKPDEFNIRILSGYSVKFLVNDKKETEALQFIQPNGIFKATKVKAK